MVSVEIIKKILPDGEDYSVRTITGGYEIMYGSSFRSPVLNFSHLRQLSELFGTDMIDVDNYSESGCETCDWGSSYGHEIQIRDITLNVEVLEELASKGSF